MDHCMQITKHVAMSQIKNKKCAKLEKYISQIIRPSPTLSVHRFWVGSSLTVAEKWQIKNSIQGPMLHPFVMVVCLEHKASTNNTTCCPWQSWQNYFRTWVLLALHSLLPLRENVSLNSRPDSVLYDNIRKDACVLLCCLAFWSKAQRIWATKITPQAFTSDHAYCISLKYISKRCDQHIFFNQNEYRYNVTG